MSSPKSLHGIQKITLAGVGHTPRVVRLSEVKSSLQVSCERGGQASLFIELAAKKPHVRHAVTFDLRPKSTLAVIFLWRGPGEAEIIERATVAVGAKFHLLNVTRGSCVQDLTSEVTGKGGESTLDWIVHLRGSDEARLSLRNVFRAQDGRGDVTVRGVAEGKAHLKCDGAIEVGPRGRGTAAYLTEKFLLLDPAAEAEAVPKLKIETDDVKAGHSAAVSRLSPDDLFYFASRGIPEKEARRMLVEGFLGELFAKGVDTELRKLLEKVVH
jgi:Fe-S cluster assembly scaffold protein SufB